MSELSPATGMRPVAPPEFLVLPNTAHRVEVRQRVMPIDDSILWSPAVDGGHRPVPAQFFTQSALSKIHGRLTGLSNGLGIGLLTGQRYTCSRSGAQFVVIDGALPLSGLAAGDEPIDALAAGMRVAMGMEIFGWYRGQSLGNPALRPGDVEAQRELFGDRPCTIVVVAVGGESGAVFRHSSSPSWPVEALPFYEWVTEPGTGADRRKATVLRWSNYRPLQALAGAGADHFQHPVLVPQSGLDDAIPAPMWQRSWSRQWTRPATYVACALAGALLVGLSWILLNTKSGSSNASGAGAIAPPEARTSALAAALFDRRADTLALAITAFGERVQMFDAHQMTCTGLARGLQQVEEGWLVYNLARREILAPFDANRESRDHSLYASVRSVEGRFEQSHCTRP